MSCTIKSTPNLTPWITGTQPGGRLYGTVRFNAICNEDGAKPECELDEDVGLVARLFSKILDRQIFDRSPPITDASGKTTGSVTIEDAGKEGQVVVVNVNLSTNANGKQTFEIKLKCRCKNTEAWTRLSVPVSFTL